MVPLVTALEDQDQLVRDAAKEAIVSIFGSPAVGAAARADLKTQLVKHGVRKTTADAVLSRVLGRHENLHDSSGSRSQTPDRSDRRSSTPSALDLKGSASSGVGGVHDAASGMRPVYVRKTAGAFLDGSLIVHRLPSTLR